MSSQSTTCSQLTAVGRSAIAVVSVRGDQATTALRANFRSASGHDYRPGQIRYGHWISTGESVVVTPLENNSFEVHCHGGVAAVDRVLSDLQSHGCTMEPATVPHDDPLIADAMIVASQCTTPRTVAVAMDQVRGAFANWLRGERTHPTVDQILQWSRWTTRLTKPFAVVLAGPPNVGKSSLVNAMVGYDRSITMDMPGTTRDVLAAETVIDGIAIEFYDTAGIRAGNDPIEREGVRRATLAASDADLVLAVADHQQSLPVDPRWSSVLQVRNKADLGNAPEPRELATVATTGQGIELVQNAILSTLINSFPPPGSPVPLTRKHADMITAV